MIQAYTQVKIKFGRPAVAIEGIWFFVDQEEGTIGNFKANLQDQFAYLVK
jgi:hypothetical protein